MRPRIARLSLACAAGISAIAFAATPAQAYPTDCSAAAVSSTASIAACLSGTGSYRAVAYCEYPDSTYTVTYGPWVYRPSSAISLAICPKNNALGGQSTLDRASYERRD
ncbi:hypothetical protein Aph01nite_45440 [Acrocarpospora phusangensis]|uniref:Uncharacterized protein n=1 Tax=Acrocarpospora phusangensis TaxID=1070424 RepID=A0A919QBP6_9ACTN|nr:hypothetical protein Aph01nite_45440 [Acrocarpospora phusangensis]